MKLNHILVVLVLGLATAAQATVFDYSWTLNAPIPDGDENGWQSTKTIQSTTPGDTSTYMAAKYTEIQDVNVTLNISGGYNGDLYGYLVSSDGFAVLLNRVGKGEGSDPLTSFGYGNNGMNIKLNDTATETTDIHQYQAVGGYSITGGAEWRPDGRTTDPSLVTSGTGDRNALLSNFIGDNPHTSWTLYFADLGSGQQSTLVSWGLQITAVPEPVTWALLIFGGMVGGFQVVRRFVVRKTE